MGGPPNSGPEERAGAAAEGPAAGAAGGPPPGPVRRLPSSPAGAGGSPPPGATAGGTSPPGAGDAAAKAGQGASGRGEAGGRTVGTPVPLMGGHSASSSQQRQSAPPVPAAEGPGVLPPSTGAPGRGARLASPMGRGSGRGPRLSLRREPCWATSQPPQRQRAVEGPAGGSTSMGSSETARRPARAQGAGEDWCWGWALGRAGSAEGRTQPHAEQAASNGTRTLHHEQCQESNCAPLASKLSRKSKRDGFHPANLTPRDQESFTEPS